MLPLTKLEIAALRGLSENIAWTHKAHEKQADIELSHSKRFRYAANALLAFSASGILGTIVADEGWLKILLAVLAFGSLAVSIHRDASCFELNYAAHTSYAKTFLGLRERMLDLLLSVGSRTEEESWKSEFKAIQEAYLSACNHAPRTSSRALEEAGEAIKKKEQSSLFDLLDALDANARMGGDIG